MELETAEELLSCECGHGLDEHNGLGCYARLAYKPKLITCECKLTDDRSYEELLMQNFPEFFETQLDELRKEFLQLLTVDNGTDARRKEFNQAIFDAEKGYAIYNGTDLSMVMGKFDKALKNKKRSG